MKVLLVNPSYGTMVTKVGRIHHRPWPPLDLLNCASIFRQAGHRVRLLDARATPIGRTDIVAEANASDLTLLTTSPLDRWQCPPLSIEPLLPLIRSLPPQRLAVTGAHGTVAPAAVIEQTGARWVVRGEPERLAFGLAAGQRPEDIPGLATREDPGTHGGDEWPAVDIESLPLPAYDDISFRRYHYELLGSRMAMLEASRGCPRNCAFCSQAVYSRPVRWKSAAKVLQEVCWVIRCGARRIMFIDLDFLSSRRRAHEILSGLERCAPRVPWCCEARADALDETTVDRMRRAGCQLIHVGVEFGSQERVTATGKDLALRSVERAIRLTRNADIEIACLFMAGYPGETTGDYEATLDYALQLAPDYVAFAPAVDYADTTAEGSSFELYETTRSAELHRFCASAMRRFYLRPRYLLSRLRRPSAVKLAARQLALFLGHVRS